MCVCVCVCVCVECVYILYVQTACEPVLPEKLFETDEGQEGEKMAQQLMEGAMREDGEEEREGEGEGESGGREEGEGEERPSSLVMKVSRYSGTGLGSLLRLCENSIQNHGSVKLDLDIPWAALISPLPEEHPPPSLACWKIHPDGETANSPPLSITDYLSLCRQHLQMTEPDLQFSRAVYEVIEQCEERGVSVTGLRGHTALRALPHSLCLDDHLQSLLNFDMVCSTLQ